jgi:CO dehydrogenase nickel-insertion accessory protein CooC1
MVRWVEGRTCRRTTEPLKRRHVGDFNILGKTTSTAALGAALASTGQNVAVVDFDIGLRHLDLVMGAKRCVIFDLHPVGSDRVVAERRTASPRG